MLGPAYTKHQHQHCNNSVMMLAILLSLKTMESLQNGVATHLQATSLFSMRTVSLVSSQSCCSVYTKRQSLCSRLFLCNPSFSVSMSGSVNTVGLKLLLHGMNICKSPFHVNAQLKLSIPCRVTN